jgi:hypothetical protein
MKLNADFIQRRLPPFCVSFLILTESERGKILHFYVILLFFRKVFFIILSTAGSGFELNTAAVLQAGTKRAEILRLLLRAYF